MPLVLCYFVRCFGGNDLSVLGGWVFHWTVVCVCVCVCTWIMTSFEQLKWCQCFVIQGCQLCISQSTYVCCIKILKILCEWNVKILGLATVSFSYMVWRALYCNTVHENKVFIVKYFCAYYYLIRWQLVTVYTVFLLCSSNHAVLFSRCDHKVYSGCLNAWRHAVLVFPMVSCSFVFLMSQLVIMGPIKGSGCFVRLKEICNSFLLDCR